MNGGPTYNDVTRGDPARYDAGRILIARDLLAHLGVTWPTSPMPNG